MQVKVIKKNRRVINMVCDGSKYIFSDTFSGVIAIAKRDTENGKHFVIEYGNSHNYYNCDDWTDLKICKAEIVKAENQYIKQDITFTEVQTKCNDKYYISLNVTEY